MRELCEIEGIKFYDTPEMGIACRIDEISMAITGKPNHGGIRQDMPNYEYVKEAFPDPEVRNEQMQFLEYPGMDKQRFISLELLLLYLERDNYSKEYKEKYDRLLRGIKENFPHLKDTPSGSGIIPGSDTLSGPDIIPDLDTATTPTQPKLPGIEKTYSYLYIAKGLDIESAPH